MTGKYGALLRKLREDLAKLKLKRHKLNEHQRSMLDFIEGKSKSSQYNLNGKIILLTRGNAKYGFKHILLNHYDTNANGRLSAREMLNIWMLLERGSQTTEYEQKDKNNKAYRLIKENTQIRLMLVYFEDKMIYRVLTYYSDRKKAGDLS